MTPEEQAQENLEGWFLDLETQLTIAQLRVLLQIASGATSHVLEPVIPWLSERPDAELGEIAFLTEATLLELGQARTLERLGLISTNEERYAWQLTATGVKAVDWWKMALQDESLKSVAGEPSPT